MKKNSVFNLISTIIEIAIFVCVVVGVFRCVLGANGTFMGGIGFLYYFTMQSNIVLALVAFVGIFINLILLFKPEIKNLKVFGIIQLVVTVSISLTGIVFCAMLAPTMPYVWKDGNQIVLHVVTPILGIVDYLICCRRYKIKWLEALYVSIEPIAYTIFVIIAYSLRLRLWANNYFPYFFYDFSSTSVFFNIYMPAPLPSICWILVLSVYILGIGFLFTAITKLFNKLEAEFPCL